MRESIIYFLGNVTHNTISTRFPLAGEVESLRRQLRASDALERRCEHLKQQLAEVYRQAETANDTTTSTTSTSTTTCTNGASTSTASAGRRTSTGSDLLYGYAHPSLLGSESILANASFVGILGDDSASLLRVSLFVLISTFILYLLVTWLISLAWISSKYS